MPIDISMVSARRAPFNNNKAPEEWSDVEVEAFHSRSFPASYLSPSSGCCVVYVKRAEAICCVAVVMWVITVCDKICCVACECFEFIEHDRWWKDVQKLDIRIIAIAKWKGIWHYLWLHGWVLVFVYWITMLCMRTYLCAICSFIFIFFNSPFLLLAKYGSVFVCSHICWFGWRAHCDNACRFHRMPFLTSIWSHFFSVCCVLWTHWDFALVLFNLNTRSLDMLNMAIQ